MDISALNNITNSSLYNNKAVSLDDSSQNDTFENIFQSALSMLSETNELTNQAQEEEVSYATGLTDDKLALLTAETKASTSLQYTVAVRNKVLEAYKEIMNLQF